METIPTARLLPAEFSRLTILEESLTRDMQTFKAVGAALAEIRDARLYRATHGTFEDYCRERWGMSRQRAFQLTEAAGVVGRLSTTVDTAPATESQARPLTRLLPEQQPIAWQAAQAAAAADSRPVTAKDVARAVNTIKRAETPKEETPQEDPQPPQEPTEPPKPGTAMCHAAEAIQCMRKIKANDPARANAFNWVRKWMNNHE